MRRSQSAHMFPGASERRDLPAPCTPGQSWIVVLLFPPREPLVIYSASNENFVPVNIGFTSRDFDSNSIDEKIESTDDCAIEPVEQAGSGALELGVWFERFQNRTR